MFFTNPVSQVMCEESGVDLVPASSEVYGRNGGCEPLPLVLKVVPSDVGG